MKARFNYGDYKGEFILIDVPKEYYYVERLTHIACMADYIDEKADRKIYDEIYDKFMSDVLDLFLKTVGKRKKKGMVAEIALPTSKHKLVFDIVQYP